jgi:aldose 1-epimerase
MFSILAQPLIGRKLTRGSLIRPRGIDATNWLVREVTRKPFGVTNDGTSVELFALGSEGGVEVQLTSYGARITRLQTRDRRGRMDDIVLGFDSLDAYLADTSYFGAVVGRYGNRIAGGRFTLDGTAYQLAVNNGPNSLHGGVRGFDKVVWHAEPFEIQGGTGVALEYTSVDMEEGFPGNLRARVTYTLAPDDRLIVDYAAVTDKATPVNLTQHTYWNLSGSARRDVREHQLMINADSITPVDSSLIPTGELASVKGTPFDFRSPMAIGARVDDTRDEQIMYGRGYDHNFVLERTDAAVDALVEAVRVLDPSTGRTLEILTTEPGLQFYSGNFLDGSVTGKDGVVYRHRYGMALETQHFPNSPNQPNFPSPILRPGQQYHSQTVFRFSTA